MVEALKYIWMDGKFVSWFDAEVHVLTHTLHYGTGVFEGIRCYNTVKGSAIFRNKEHYERLFNSAKIVKKEIPFSAQQLMKASKELVKKNKVKECYIRPIVYLGYGPMGVNTFYCPVNVSIIAWPWGAYLGKGALDKGVKTIISSFKRHHGFLNSAKICGNYYISSLAKREALEKGADECIMLDDRGFVAEGSGENIFIIKDGTIKTPELGSVLPGITRASIIQLARDLDFRVKEKNFTKEELLEADEAFFTGTAAELTPIEKVDSKDLGGRGPITEELQKKFFEIVNGKNEKYINWLDFI